MTAAIAATGAAVVTKLAENAGEKVGKALWDGTAKFMEILKEESPGTMMVIEQAPEVPLDYGQAVLEVESAAKVNPQLKQVMQELAAATKAESHPKLDEVIKEIQKAVVESQQSRNEEYGGKVGDNVTADKGSMVANKIEIGSQHNENKFY